MAITLYKPDEKSHTFVACDKCKNNFPESVKCECYKEHGYAISFYDGVQYRIKSYATSG